MDFRTGVENFLETQNSDQNADVNSNAENYIHSKVTGTQLPYFSKKRFNRFPRFNIFYKKGDQVEQSQYVLENTVSLNSDFLKFLVDKRHM